MSRIRALILGIAMLAAATGPLRAAVAPTGPTLPKWPQTFALGNGQQVNYLVPVFSAGRVVVKVEWTGSPLSLTLKDPKGSVVATVPPKAAPIAFEYLVTDADLARGPFWQFTLAPPPQPVTLSPDKKSVVVTVKGSVTAAYPEFDAVKARDTLLTLQTRQDAAFSAMKQKNVQLAQSAPSVAGKAVIVPRPERESFLISQQAKALTTYKAVVASPGAATISATGAVAAIKPGGRKITPLATAAPSITSVAPTNGSPGDVVTLKCASITDPARITVVFAFSTGTVVAEQVAPPVVDSTTYETAFKVKVPKSPVDYPATTNIPLTLVDQSPNVSSAPATCAYDPFPAPVISAVDPAVVRANGVLNVRGDRFQAGDQAHFVIPGLGDVVSPNTTFSSATLLVAKVPQFHAGEALDGQVYVVNRGGKSSGRAAFVTEINQASVTSTYPTQATPGEDIVLSGRLLGSVTGVTYTVRPRNQQPAGTVYIADALYGATPQSLQIIQKSDAALVVRVAPHGGFSGPLLIDLSINGSGLPLKVPFTVNPDYINVSYRVPCESTTFQAQETGDHWVTKPELKYPASAWIWAMRESGFMNGHWGTDFYCSLPWHLATKYNWTFVDAEFSEGGLWSNAVLGGSGVTTTAVPGLLSDVLWVSVNWSCDTIWMGQSAVMYNASINLRGPAGVPLVIHNDGVQVVLPGQ